MQRPLRCRPDGKCPPRERCPTALCFGLSGERNQRNPRTQRTHWLLARLSAEVMRLPVVAARAAQGPACARGHRQTGPAWQQVPSAPVLVTTAPRSSASESHPAGALGGSMRSSARAAWRPTPRPLRRPTSLRAPGDAGQAVPLLPTRHARPIQWCCAKAGCATSRAVNPWQCRPRRPADRRASRHATSPASGVAIRSRRSTLLVAAPAAWPRAVSLARPADAKVPGRCALLNQAQAHR